MRENRTYDLPGRGGRDWGILGFPIGRFTFKASLNPTSKGKMERMQSGCQHLLYYGNPLLVNNYLLYDLSIWILREKTTGFSVVFCLVILIIYC